MIELNKEQLRLNLKVARMKAGFTQKDVNDKFKKNALWLSRIENNPEKIPFTTFVELANLYGCTINDFFMDCDLTQS